MSECKWTPGPWRVVPYNAGDVDEWSMWTPMIDGSEDADRTVVHWAGFRQKYWQSADGKDSEIEANAHLIAAAPDLYEALEEMVEALEYHMGLGVPNKETNEASAALAKARGDA